MIGASLRRKLTGRLGDDASDEGEVFSEGLPLPVAVAYEYIGGNLALHFHFRKRSGFGELDHGEDLFCAEFQFVLGIDDPPEARRVNVGDGDEEFSHVPAGLEPCVYRVDDAVLLGIPKIVEGEQRIVPGLAGSLVRLLPLDECPHFVRGSGKFSPSLFPPELPAPSSLGDGSFPLVLRPDDRPGRPPHLSSAPFDQITGEMVKRGSQVMNDFINHQGENWRRWFRKPDQDDIAALPLVDLTSEAPGFFYRHPGEAPRFDFVEVFLRPVQLPLNSFQPFVHGR